MHRSLLSPLVAACALLLPARTFAQAYHVNNLLSPGAVATELTGTSGSDQVGGAALATSRSHAFLFHGEPFAPVDLHPADPIWSHTVATGTDGLQQGGWGYMGYGWTHALLWSGSAASVIDLHPVTAQFNNSSYCLGVHHGEQVGYQNGPGTPESALSWHGSAASVVVLHPYSLSATANNVSRALGCYNGEEVGYVSRYSESSSFAIKGYRATLWHGTAASEVDLHPAGYDESIAACTSGTQQGGWGTLQGVQHALLWTGEAASAVDLHPEGYNFSQVNGMNATQQVGEAWILSPTNAAIRYRHALVWSGSAGSVVDLNQFLPDGSDSVATGIDADGNIVGYAYIRPGPNYSHTFALPVSPWAVPVMWKRGPRPSGQLSSVTVTPADPAPGTTLQGQVTLEGTAPAGGVSISFLSTDTSLIAAPAALVIPEGESSATFSVSAGGNTLIRPQSLRLYATDGTVGPTAGITITPVIHLASLTVNAVEGGFPTTGSVSLDIPAPSGGAAVALSSGNTSLAAVPANVVVPFNYEIYRPNVSRSFTINTAPVAVTTVVPITATYNGTTLTTSLTLLPAPPISILSLTAPEVVGGYAMTVTVTVDNFPRSAPGAIIALTSSDPATLQVPASVTIAAGAFTASVNATTVAVSKRKAVTLTATYNGVSVSAATFVSPIPTVTIGHADYFTDTHEFKVDATTTFTNAVMTFGTSPTGPALGTLVNEAGVFKGSIILNTAPTQATVWNSLGGQATISVRQRTSTVVAGGGGGGGGGTTSTYKLSLSTNGKGTVTVSPSAASYAAGTVVTLTASPAAGSSWTGWSGDATGTANPTTLTMTKDMKVTANFR